MPQDRNQLKAGCIMRTGRAVSAPFDQTSLEDGTGLCLHRKQARHIRFKDRASWSLLPTTKRQLGSRQTTEARRGLAPKSLVNSESFQPLQTPVNISSWMEGNVETSHFLEGKNNVQTTCGTVEPPKDLSVKCQRLEAIGKEDL